jgi:hypothetical protein
VPAAEECDVSQIETDAFRKQLEEERARLLHATGRLHAETAESMEDTLGELATRGVDNHPRRRRQRDLRP